MKFSCQWLQQWVDLDLDADDLAERLTATGLEVDSVTPVAAHTEKVVVGEIIECAPHPDADRLRVCRVEAGQGEPLEIVCGAPNAAVGLKAPLALVGGAIGEDFEVRQAKLRGVASHGMLCSARELGLGDDHDGLLALPADTKVGADIRQVLGLDDHMIEVELTPNRADCLSIQGLARDVAASCDAPLTPLDVAPVAPTHDEQRTVHLEAPADCPRYVGRVIRGIDPTAKTPLWMVERLRRSGIRSISPTVDCTNYVLMELGQPMHAFDLDRLEGDIVVRRGRDGETLQLLDGRDVTIDDDVLVIADDSGAVALGGVMGGASTGVTDETRNVYLESAYFDPAVIMGRARRFGMHTDASHRFERGVDPAGQERAIERITALLLDIVGGEPGPVVVTEEPDHVPVRPEVTLRLQRLNRVLGSNLGADDVQPILDRLGMASVYDEDEQRWRVTAPTPRFDIAIEEDLIEEVARVYGYDRLPTAIPSGELTPDTPSESRVPDADLRRLMCGSDYQEAVTYSFVDGGLLQRLGLEQGALPLANPISSDMDHMRTSLLPGLLEALARNQRRQRERVRLFEIGTVFNTGADPFEQRRIAAVAVGPAAPEQWGVERRPLDFHDIKGDVERLLALRGLDEAGWTAGKRPWLHPGQQADVSLGGRVVGWVGAIHPGLLSQLDIDGPVMAFEFDAAAIAIRELPNVNEISKFPSVRRDLSFVVPDAVTFDEVREVVENHAHTIMTNLLIFDVFKGKGVETGYKSLSIGLILQDVSSTLSDEVVDPVIQDVIEGLKTRLGAQLRGTSCR